MDYPFRDAFRNCDCKLDTTSSVVIQVNVGRYVEVLGKKTAVFYLEVSAEKVGISPVRPDLIHYTYTPPVKPMRGTWFFEHDDHGVVVGQNGNIGSLCIDAYRTHIRIFCTGMATKSLEAWNNFPTPDIQLAVRTFDREEEPEIRTLLSKEFNNGWDVTFLMGDINPPEKPEELYQAPPFS